MRRGTEDGREQKWRLPVAETCSASGGRITFNRHRVFLLHPVPPLAQKLTLFIFLCPHFHRCSFSFSVYIFCACPWAWQGLRHPFNSVPAPSLPLSLQPTRSPVHESNRALMRSHFESSTGSSRSEVTAINRHTAGHCPARHPGSPGHTVCSRGERTNYMPVPLCGNGRKSMAVGGGRSNTVG